MSEDKREVTLQESHDNLAGALAMFADQLLRGSHMPLIYQWLQVAQALRDASPLIDTSNKVRAYVKGYTADFAEVIQAMCDEQAKEAGLTGPVKGDGKPTLAGAAATRSPRRKLPTRKSEADHG